MIVKQNPKIISRRVGSTWLVLESNHKYVRQLNKTAGVIWSLTKAPVSVDRLAQAVSARFHISYTVAVRDVKDFVELYCKEGLLMKVPRKAAGA
jgi:hypothetical protein